MVFDGSGSQTVSLQGSFSGRNRFNDVEVRNPVNVIFDNAAYTSGNLDLHGRLDGHDGGDTIAGRLTLRTGSTLDNDPALFTVGSCARESDITILGTDPCP